VDTFSITSMIGALLGEFLRQKVKLELINHPEDSHWYIKHLNICMHCGHPCEFLGKLETQFGPPEYPPIVDSCCKCMSRIPYYTKDDGYTDPNIGGFACKTCMPRLRDTYIKFGICPMCGCINCFYISADSPYCCVCANRYFGKKEEKEEDCPCSEGRI